MFKQSTTNTALEIALLAIAEGASPEMAEIAAADRVAPTFVEGEDYQGEDLFGDLAA
jgi:hypothetical protein